MSNLKMFGAVAVMIACFAIVYPRFMHPLVLRALGLYEPPKKTAEQNMYPPNYKAMHPEHRKPAADEVRKHMRPGPHPGMRASAEMQRQQAQQGSGRGMMGVVLPMYAVGIVLYLVYTLFKVFNKSKNNSWNTQRGQYNRRGQRGGSVDRMGFPTNFDGSGDVQSFLSDQQQRQELEDLLSRVDDKNVSIDEMRVLQKRLEETEAQMSRILQAMQSVQTNVQQMNIPETAEEQSNDLSPGMNDQDKTREQEETESDDGEKQESERTDSEKVTEDGEGEKTEVKEFQDGAQNERKMKKEVDLDGIDKDSDENNEDNYDAREGQDEDENDEEEIRDEKDVDEGTESKVRHRKKNS